MHEFLHQLGVFAFIAGALLVLNVAQTWLNQMFRMELRTGLTRDLFAQWLVPKRAFMLGGAGEIGINPDQRIHEDARHLSDLTTDLGAGLLQAALLLASFIGVLWGLSAGVTFELAGKNFVIPGYMVWSALFYAGAASLAGWLVGRPLINLDATHYARESDVRYALVHVNEHREGVSVYRGEAEEEEKLNRTFDRLLVGTAPARPRNDQLDLGDGGLWLVHDRRAHHRRGARLFRRQSHVGRFADERRRLHPGPAIAALVRRQRWRDRGLARHSASCRRLSSRPSRNRQNRRDDEQDRIRRIDGRAVDFDDVSVFLPTGSIGLSEGHVEIAPGARVLIVGAPGSGKTCLFRALAGLWPWGAGRINVPAAMRVIFMPKRPFIPDGALNHVLAYPASPETFQDEQFLAALTRVGLAYLAPDLRRAARWDQELTYEEQLGVAFARLLLHKPDCVIVDETIEALAPETRDAVFDFLAKELASTSLLAIGGPRAEATRYTRVLRLVFDPAGRRVARLGELTESAGE